MATGPTSEPITGSLRTAGNLFAFKFAKSITLGDWLAGALLWHFAAMWLLMVNGLAYLIVGFTSGRFKGKLLPISADGVISDTKAALTGKLSHEDLSKYNQVQKLLYAGIIAVGVVIVLSGLSMWKAASAARTPSLNLSHEAGDTPMRLPEAAIRTTPDR